MTGAYGIALPEPPRPRPGRRARPGRERGRDASAAAAATPTASSFVAAGSIRFPVAIDTKRIVGVTSVPGGHQVTMSDSLNPGSADNTLEHYLFFDNGRIGFPVYETRGVSVVSSNGVVWPDAAGMASGRPYHSVLNIKLSSGTSETADVTVQGGGTQSVSVPAGTFRATLVNMYIVTKVGSLHSIARLRVWTAPGTGPVRIEQVVKAGAKTQLITTSALLSFTKQAADS